MNSGDAECERTKFKLFGENFARADSVPMRIKSEKSKMNILNCIPVSVCRWGDTKHTFARDCNDTWNGWWAISNVETFKYHSIPITRHKKVDVHHWWIHMWHVKGKKMKKNFLNKGHKFQTGMIRLAFYVEKYETWHCKFKQMRIHIHRALLSM